MSTINYSSQIKFSLLNIFIFGFFFSCNENSKDTSYIQTLEPDWKSTQVLYLQEINKTIVLLDSLKDISPNAPEAKEIFKKIRIAFKKAEPYASYLNPEVGHRINSPALPIYKEDNGKTLYPIGLQKIEESIYEGESSKKQYKNELKTTIGLLNSLKKSIEKRELTAQRYFIATHQQLFRVLSFSISGFDTPVSQLGIQESRISLQNLYDSYVISIQKIIQSKNKDLDMTFKKQIEAATYYTASNPDFDSFDRYTFIKEYLNPITRSWVAIRKTSKLWEGTNSQPFNFDAPTFFENDSYNVSFFISGTNKKPTDAQIKLGKKLFFDKKLSANNQMACATCHIPSKAYTDGLMLNKGNKGNNLKRNTPTLINTIFQKNFFWDGRSHTLMDQVSSVFTNTDEFNSNVHTFSKDILQDSTYKNLFQEAYRGVSNRNIDVIKAIAAYVATLNGFNSKFDRNMRGEEDTFTQSEKEGMNLFMGKALCATCHFIPLTNGTVPPFFQETEREVIGVPNTSENRALDDDLGYYWKFNESLHKGMFKTPTVRNASLTAPYMHNGVYNTLEEVIDFYNKGGGGGLGFDLEHQTLPFDNLKLTDKEQRALVDFVKTLTDTQVDSY
ncbi:cytochrome c peroxidase [uncultured Dokdonia sp.]|uniref:cytochrome-c peroxidase n=1 Tax=uncultured Dokdonia sp. TaxID=575653 RepID=UPI00260AFEA9|nr:cytochrome c peroxidase [uncultured Dokdonia sp.]